MEKFQQVKEYLSDNTKTWLVTGVAGFIGSNLLEFLLSNNQRVVGVDNFATGKKQNLELVEAAVGSPEWSNFHFIEGDISDEAFCANLCDGVEFILHQAALGSVPRSIANPIASNRANVTGFLNLINVAKSSDVQKVVYAASSSTYGDSEKLPKVEDIIGKPLSPYAVTKYVNELYADVFGRAYGLRSVGLRYFNVFGKRQDPNGAYAAVIPKWIADMKAGKKISINGDGSTSRDFCYIENVIQANILAAVADIEGLHTVFNVAVGKQNTLLQLFHLIKDELGQRGIDYDLEPEYLPFREGDVMHSLADISKISSVIGYDPKFDLKIGLEHTIDWFLRQG